MLNAHRSFVQLSRSVAIVTVSRGACITCTMACIVLRRLLQNHIHMGSTQNIVLPAINQLVSQSVKLPVWGG